MSLAASLHIDHNLQSSISDVYGNDLEDVDVWGDDGSNGSDGSSKGRQDQSYSSPPPTSNRKVPNKAPPPRIPKSPKFHKPPRTPSGNVRNTARIEQVLQKKNSTLRRSCSGSESDLRSTDAEKNILPPMTPRTRMRRGLMTSSSFKHNNIPSPSVDCVASQKPISAAEKRRQRHHESLSHASEESSSQTFETFESSCSSLNASFGNLLCPSGNNSSTRSLDIKEAPHASRSCSLPKCNMLNSSIPLIDLLQIDESGNDDNVKDLQKHRKEVFPTMFSESAPVLSSVETKDHHLEKAQSAADRKHRPRSVSRNRDPQETRRSGSVPRAGEKIKLLRRSNSGRNTGVGDGGSTCTDEDKSRKSASEKSTKSSKSKSSRSSSRSAPRRCASSSVAANVVRKGAPPRSQSAKNPEGLASPTGRGGTPRRKIKYIKKSESMLLANESFGKLEF